MKFNRSAGARVIFACGFSLVLGATGCSSNKTDEGKQGVGNGSANWTMQGWDIGSTFHNKAEKRLTRDNVKDLKLLWEVVHPSAGTPAIVDGVVYVAGGSRTAAYDIKTGKRLWRSNDSTDPPITVGTSASPAYVDGHIYFLTGGQGWAVSLNAADGALEWFTQYETNVYASGYSSVIPVGDTLVAGNSSSEEGFVADGATFRGGVVAFDRKSGEQKWKMYTANEQETGCGVWGSVAVDKEAGTVFAGTGNNYTGAAGPGSDAVFSLKIDDGGERWRKQVTENDVFTVLAPKSPDTDFGANVVVYEFDGKKIVAAGQKSGDLYLFDRETGEEIAHRDLGDSSALIGGIFQAVSFDGERLLVVSNSARSEGPGSVPGKPGGVGTSVLFSLHPTKLDIFWERQLAAAVWNPITIANGVGFVGPGNVLQAFNTETGEILREWEFVGTLTGGAAISNGNVCVQSGISYFAGIRDNKFRCFGFEGGGGQMGGTDDEPTFTNVYEQVIEAGRCAEALCHGSGKAGNLGLGSKQEAFDQLVGVTASGTSTTVTGCNGTNKIRVQPDDPDASLLVEKLGTSPSCGERMPPTGEPLGDAAVKLVRDWIAAGAPNN